jgi:hypothetical protein
MQQAAQRIGGGLAGSRAGAIPHVKPDESG